MTTFARLMWLALAGSLGVLARYGLSGFVQRQTGLGFPWGTLAVNVLGCFLFGFIWSLAEERSLLPAQFRTVALVGFLGAFTTFSSYAFETVSLLQEGAWFTAAANVTLQNVGGLVALLVGLAVGRLL